MPTIYVLVEKLEKNMGVQWLSGRVLNSRPRGRRFEPHQRHCVVSLSKNINPSLVLVQPRKTGIFITERLLMGRKESNQTESNILCINRCIKIIIVMHSKCLLIWTYVYVSYPQV